MLRVAPRADEAEVSLFGPGFGECVLLHLGNNEWMIVDSCVDSKTNQQPALAYLESIGVAPEEAVKSVLVTHWHADHVRGMADVIAACASAELWISGSLRSKELAILASQYGREAPEVANPYKEFKRVLDALKERALGLGRQDIVRPAGCDQLLYSRLGASTVKALSPSARDVEHTFRRFARLAGYSIEEKRSVNEPAPNSCAVAISYEFGEHRALLGSDLEEVASEESGWKAIVSQQRDAMLPAQLFKVPHHGSATGHNDDVWETLVDDPVSILTPYRQSGLPNDEDIRRIRALSSGSYATASPYKVTPPQPKGPRRRALHTSAKAVYDTQGKSGHIQARASSAPGDWVVRLSHPARELLGRP